MNKREFIQTSFTTNKREFTDKSFAINKEPSILFIVSLLPI
jgi:hypothetical protein